MKRGVDPTARAGRLSRHIVQPSRCSVRPMIEQEVRVACLAIPSIQTLGFVKRVAKFSRELEALSIQPLGLSIWSLDFSIRSHGPSI
jgi:hypothetical protein